MDCGSLPYQEYKCGDNKDYGGIVGDGDSTRVDVDVALSKRVMMLIHHSEKRMINRSENDGSDVSKWLLGFLVQP
jgi:hypothetical protein